MYFDSSSSGEEEEGKEGDQDRRQEGMEVGGGNEEGDSVAGRSGGSAKKVRKLTDDELFYDPKMDEKDARWIKRCRMAYHNGGWRQWWVETMVDVDNTWLYFSHEY